MGRRLRWAAAGTVLLGLVALVTAATALALLRVDPGQAWDEFQSRSPGEIVRYLKRRLQNHDKLEAVLVPPLNWIQRQVERPVAIDKLPLLGKGPGSPVAQQRIADTGPGLRDRIVDTTESLREALWQAQAGETILIAPGTYRIDRQLETRQGGLPDQPITVRPLRPDSVQIEVYTVAGLRITQPHWRVIGLSWRGACPNHDQCEHAIHVAGGAHDTRLLGHRMVDFNAHIKVNGERGSFPDHGRIEHNHLANTSARRTARPVAAVDLVGASAWVVADNVFEHLVKGGGNQVSYAAMMKGAGRQGRFERNLVVCTTSGISQPGLRVGISFGGGGTGPAYCRDQRCDAEFQDGVVQDNIVAHCNDAGVDINTSLRTLVLGNTLINTAGVQLRGEPSSAIVRANLMDGDVRHRPGSTVEAEGNEIGDSTSWFADPDALDLRWADLPGADRSGRTDPDFCGRSRTYGSPAGALSSAGPCGR